MRFYAFRHSGSICKLKYKADREFRKKNLIIKKLKITRTGLGTANYLFFHFNCRRTLHLVKYASLKLDC